MKDRLRGTVVPVVVFVSLMLPLWGGFTDDGYIHIQYANNIITRGEYSFNPGEVSFGTTSPLWVMAHAAIGKLAGGGERLMATSRVLSWLGGIVSVVLIYVLARAMGLGPWMAWLCTLAFGAHAWLVRWTALAMESSSAVAALTATGIASLGAFQDERRAWRLGFFMAVASLLRPEAYLLLPVYLGTVLLQRRRVRAACVVRTVAIYAALLVPWLLFARLHIGAFLPNTAGAKSGGLVLNPVVLLEKLIPIAKIVASAEAIPVLLIIAAVVVLKRKSRVLSVESRFLATWIVTLPLAYAVFDIQVLSRYMLLTSPFVVVLGYVALDECSGALAWVRQRRRAVAAAVTLAAVGLNVVLYFQVVVGPSRAFSSDLTHGLKELGTFLDRNAPADAVVAAADIGYLAFYSHRRVLDLGGLVEDVTARLRARYTYEEIVDRGLYLGIPAYPRVDYFIDRVKVAERFDGSVINGHRFEALRVTRVRNLGIKKPGPFYYTLYRLEPVEDG
ncbi:MAG: hypothetical protein ACE5EO_02860 [Candidatus Krumholzibacteriia bacterium]